MIREVAEELDQDDEQQGLYLTFELDNEYYGLWIGYVTEIIGILPFTEVPELPAYVRGIFNLRGRIIPLMDLRLRFQKKFVEYDERSCVIVIDVAANTVGLIVVGMVLLILLGIFIATTIKKPVNQMVTASQRMADGDLDVTIDINTRDEMGDLATAFNRMAGNINEVMVNINEAIEQVASGSRQVSDSSISLSQGATEQASSIEELTASIEEIASQTRLNAENAEQANQLAEDTKENANQGNKRMQQMLGSMEDISESSNNISKIIKVIDEIAFQTNILALNAAVEAAKAGQNGKGFAVVAVEVRNLAARSASAAKETTALIEGSIKKVEGGTKIANETAAALVQIVDSIEKVYGLVTNISVASNEQAIGVEQINQGISQIANVVQATSATSQETAAASEELASQAEMLKEQVSRFKLKRGGFMGTESYENMSPEMMRMFENMKEQNRQAVKKRSGQASHVPAARTIILSDDEFGKY